MRYLPKLAAGLLVPFALAATALPATTVLNQIQGIVYDPSRVPVNDVRVELQNEVGSLLQSDKTHGGGRFGFVGISSGKFIIKVIPVGMDYQEETKTVDVESFSRTGGGGDTEYVDVYLRRDIRRGNSTPKGPPEAIFVQDVPADAKKAFESGRGPAERGEKGGIADLEKAIAAFPTYFDALLALGTAHMRQKEYAVAYPYLLRAIDVNQRSYSTYYDLGICFFYLNLLEASQKAADAALTISPDFANAHLLEGMLYRSAGKYKESEAELLKASSLASPANPEIAWQLALLYNKIGRNDDAIAQLQTFLKQSPNNSERKKVEDLIDKLKKAKKT